MAEGPSQSHAIQLSAVPWILVSSARILIELDSARSEWNDTDDLRLYLNLSLRKEAIIGICN